MSTAITIKRRLEALNVKDGDIVYLRGKRYVFCADSWFYGSLEGDEVLSPNYISRTSINAEDLVVEGTKS